MNQIGRINWGALIGPKVGSLIATILMCPGVSGQQCPTFHPGTQVGTVAHGSLDEISGLVVSRQNAGVLWVHNDSGDSARVFAMNESGAHLGIYNLSGASAVDYEDIAMGPGPSGGTDYLYIADTGNNSLNRNTVIVYRVPEPVVTSNQSPVDVNLAGVDSLPMTYPGDAYDCETLLVDPDNGDLYLVTRDRDGLSGNVSFVFRNPAPHTPGINVTLELVTSFSAPLQIKGGDISDDGTQILLRSSQGNNPVDARWWSWDGVSSLATVFAQAGCSVPAASEPQGEAIAFAADGLSYFTVSENANQPIYQYQLATPPAAPSALGATGQSSSEISLNWTDHGTDEDGFEIYESLDGVDYFLSGTVGSNVTSALVTGLQANTLYYYFVRAFNVAGEADSNVASATTLSPTLPAAPSSLVATAVSGTQIDLNWIDNANDESGFKLYESLDGVSFALIGSTGANVTSAALNGLQSETTYHYYVRAFNLAGGSNSGVASATTLAPTPITLFADGFESGDLLAANWTVTSPASVTSSAAKSGNYGALLKKSAALAKTIGSGGATSATISYWRSVSGLNAGEFFFVECSSDGSNWVVLEQTGGSAPWAFMEFPIAVAASSLELRFRLSGSSGNDTASVDDVLVTASVSSPNTLPVANDDAFSVDEDASLSVASPGVLGNDSDADDDAISAVLITDVGSGTLNLAGDGSFTFEPDLNFHGVDSFTYVADDGLGSSAFATVTITVNPLPDAPLANGDSYSTEPGIPLVVVAPGVLGNDTDADDDSLSAVVFTGPTNGTLDLATNGSFEYTPDQGFEAVDSFVYTADDGNGGTNNATVMITVQPVVGPTSGHVDSIVVDHISLGKGRKQGHALVIVRDDLGNLVAGASVTGTFSEDLSETLTVTTDANGVAEFGTAGSVKGSIALTFCVDDISLAGLSYDPVANVETCDTNY